MPMTKVRSWSKDIVSYEMKIDSSKCPDNGILSRGPYKHPLPFALWSLVQSTMVPQLGDTPAYRIPPTGFISYPSRLSAGPRHLFEIANRRPHRNQPFCLGKTPPGGSGAMIRHAQKWSPLLENSAGASSSCSLRCLREFRSTITIELG